MRYKRGSPEGFTHTTEKTAGLHSKREIHGGKKRKIKYDLWVRIPLAQGKETHALDDSRANQAFTWEDPERGRFKEEYFLVIKIPTVVHVP